MLNEQFKKLSSKLEEVNKRAEGAVELAMSTKEDTNELRQDCKEITEKLLMMDISSQQLNIKLKSFLEKGEKGVVGKEAV